MNVVPATQVLACSPQGLQSLVFKQRPVTGASCLLLAVGDLGFSGRVGITAREKGFDAILYDVAPMLRSGDIVFGNLEFPLAGAIRPDAMFSAHPQTAASLKRAGFSVLNLATNHAAEFGVEGLIATLNAVRSEGLTPLGAGVSYDEARKIVRTDINGLRIGWLAAGKSLAAQDWDSPHYWEFNEEELLSAVRSERDNVDILIVSLHLGLMYLDYPRPEHKSFAETLLLEGVDLILMHHAHVLQGVQVMNNGGVVAYNLGNFVLDWSEGNVEANIAVKEQNEGGIFVFQIDRDGIAVAAMIPTFIDDDGCVRLAYGKRGLEILNRLERISADLKGDYVPLFERQRAERNAGHVFKVLMFHIRRGNLGYVLREMSRIRLEHVVMSLRWVYSKIRRGKTREA